MQNSTVCFCQPSVCYSLQHFIWRSRFLLSSSYYLEYSPLSCPFLRNSHNIQPSFKISLFPLSFTHCLVTHLSASDSFSTMALYKFIYLLTWQYCIHNLEVFARIGLGSVWHSLPDSTLLCLATSPATVRKDMPANQALCCYIDLSLSLPVHPIEAGHATVHPQNSRTERTTQSHSTHGSMEIISHSWTFWSDAMALMYALMRMTNM